MKRFDDLGVAVPDILLPAEGTDLEKWSVVACDQFTSEPDYWRQVYEVVGDSPSTLNLIFPEIYLDVPGKDERIHNTQRAMEDYLSRGLLRSQPGMIHVVRRLPHGVRRGLLLCLDLERYDYRKGSGSLIRATEGTIVERLPPRMAIREGAALEIPHILVLIDDPGRTVIEPLAGRAEGRDPLYDFELMLNSGHLTGYALTESEEDQVVSGLRALAQPGAFRAKYGLTEDAPVLLFAMGDGNHSLATAKAVWEQLKDGVASDHPSRFALVEIENVHDDGLRFEPIHRVLFGLQSDVMVELQKAFGRELEYRSVASMAQMMEEVSTAGALHTLGLVRGDGLDRHAVLTINRPSSNLPVGTLQRFLDEFMRRAGAERIDYVHGAETLESMGSQVGNAGFYLPAMRKSDLFKTVILDGALPRKTFSMGEAREKRFYMEARRIS